MMTEKPFKKWLEQRLKQIHGQDKQFYSHQGSRVTERKATKEHECVECGGIIEAGEDYYEITYEGEDCGHHTVRVCFQCWSGER